MCNNRSVLTGSPGSGITLATCKEKGNQLEPITLFRHLILYIRLLIFVLIMSKINVYLNKYLNNWLYVLHHTLVVTCQWVKMHTENTKVKDTHISWNPRFSTRSDFALRRETQHSLCLNTNDLIKDQMQGDHY